MFDKNYWNQRYIHDHTPWDIGQVSPPLRSYLDTLTNPDLRILLPGAGRAYEAIYLHEKGFRQVMVCDWAEESFHHLKTVAPGFPEKHQYCRDFFTLQEQFDLIVEQTFFCALDPSLRSQYVRKMADLLPEGGVVAGVLFASNFGTPGPPFGGTAQEYEQLFSAAFKIEKLEICKNSIRPRAENELFFKLIKL